MNFKEKECGTTKLTLQIGDTVAIVEKQGMDPSTGDIFQMLYGAMVSMTFLPCTVIDGMRDFAEDNTDWTTSTGKDTEGQ